MKSTETSWLSKEDYQKIASFFLFSFFQRKLKGGKKEILRKSARRRLLCDASHKYWGTRAWPCSYETGEANRNLGKQIGPVRDSFFFLRLKPRFVWDVGNEPEQKQTKKRKKRSKFRNIFQAESKILPCEPSTKATLVRWVGRRYLFSACEVKNQTRKREGEREEKRKQDYESVRRRHVQ